MAETPWAHNDAPVYETGDVHTEIERNNAERLAAVIEQAKKNDYVTTAITQYRKLNQTYNWVAELGLLVEADPTENRIIKMAQIRRDDAKDNAWRMLNIFLKPYNDDDYIMRNDVKIFEEILKDVSERI